MVTKQLLFKPSVEELIVLDENNIRWSTFCHENIKRLGQKGDELLLKKKSELQDKIILRIILVAMGCFIFAFSPLLNDIFLVIIEYVIGGVMVVGGSISLVLMWRKEKDA